MSTVLIIGAHPDDIDFGCAGYMVQLNKIHKIVCVIVSNGDKGGASCQIRKTEQLNSIKKISIDIDVIFLDLPDAYLYNYMGNIISELSNIIIKYKPEIVITTCESDTHQDHKTVFASTLASCNHKTFIKQILTYETPSIEKFNPNFFVEIPERDMELKIKVLQSHSSQIHKYYFSPDLIKAIGITNGSRGRLHGYAEAFKIIRLTQGVL